MLNNGDITADQVKNIKDDVIFYIDSNQDEDFSEDLGIYDELDLDENIISGIDNDQDSGLFVLSKTST